MKTKIMSYLYVSIVLILCVVKSNAQSDSGVLYFKMYITSIVQQNSIEQKFIGKPGIIDVYSDPTQEIFSVMYDPLKLKEDDIYDMMQKAGYRIHFEYNNDFTINNVTFKISPKDTFEINKIENSLKHQNNVVDVYIDITKNELNILYLSYIKDEKTLINYLVKSGLKNTNVITYSDSKTIKTGTVSNAELTL